MELGLIRNMNIKIKDLNPFGENYDIQVTTCINITLGPFNVKP